MAEEREQVRSAELARWLALGVVVLVGVGLYLAFGVGIAPVARPGVLDGLP